VETPSRPPSPEAGSLEWVYVEQSIDIVSFCCFYLSKLSVERSDANRVFFNFDIVVTLCTSY